jgi:hypothetical protein
MICAVIDFTSIVVNAVYLPLRTALAPAALKPRETGNTASYAALSYAIFFVAI